MLQDQIRVLDAKVEGVSRVLEENKDIEEKLKLLQLENEKIQNEIEDFQEFQKKIGDLKEKIKQTQNSLGIIQLDKREIVEETELVEKKMNNLNCLAEEVQGIIREKQTKILEIQGELKACKEYELEIVEKLAFHINQEADKAGELIKCKITLAEAKSTCQKFNVRRIWMMSSTPAILSIKKTPDSLYSLHMEESEKVQVLQFDELDSVFLHPTKNDHFFIKISKDSIQEYFSEDAEKIVELIRELLLKTILHI